MCIKYHSTRSEFDENMWFPLYVFTFLERLFASPVRTYLVGVIHYHQMNPMQQNVLKCYFTPGCTTTHIYWEVKTINGYATSRICVGIVFVGPYCGRLYRKGMFLISGTKLPVPPHMTVGCTCRIPYVHKVRVYVITAMFHNVITDST